MKPMFSYFGSKYKSAKHYGAPRFDTVIEPFAGSAAYSLYWEPKKVILIEKNPVIAGIWNYLINATPKDILNLPTDFSHIDEIDACIAAKNLIGLWLGKGRALPAKTRSSWGRKYEDAASCRVWGAAVKDRIASQLEKIRHWVIFQCDYTLSPDVEAHWFIDPPYELTGNRYPFCDIDYTQLAIWSNNRRGYVQVCENEGAAWLPFQKFMAINSYHKNTENGRRMAKYSFEAIYEINYINGKRGDQETGENGAK